MYIYSISAVMLLNAFSIISLYLYFVYAFRGKTMIYVNIFTQRNVSHKCILVVVYGLAR